MNSHHKPADMIQSKDPSPTCSIQDLKLIQIFDSLKIISTVD